MAGLDQGQTLGKFAETDLTSMGAKAVDSGAVNWPDSINSIQTPSEKVQAALYSIVPKQTPITVADYIHIGSN